ncbi:c-type cytochrome [Paracoccus aerodenitrificans]|uniref:c-type cytochrome n=1 Tax=Paracoccus aerodenitrificans TaxID=3017781 RepID=UPI0022F0C772|nr:cytochrome c family protein [Paracoccus aerodenitrificans]WBU65222.1 cytochrome c family protein [Paracoccus aerodenitrificans]
MFNTMTITKTSGALIGSLLALLLLFWGANSLFLVRPPAGADHGEEVAQAYSIEVEGGGTEEVVEEEIDFGALMASADAGAGERVFGKCRACHKLDGTDGIGPHLNGVVGRAVAGIDGFSYSGGMVDHVAEAPEWTPEALQAFIEDPSGVVSGTKMTFAGISDAQDRADLIAYLQSQP